MAKTQLELSQEIGLSNADIQEFKDTGAYSTQAQGKIDAYKQAKTPTSQATPLQPVEAPIVSQTPIQPVGTQAPVNTPKLPEATPIPTQPVEKVEIKTTETATQPITPKPTNLGVIQGKNITSEAPQFKGADGQTYKTVRFDDGSLGTVRVGENGVNELVGNTYKDEQRADMKQIVEQGLNNAENVYRQIATGGVIPDVVKNSSVYSSAKKRFDEFSMYSTMNDAQLGSAIGNGNILPGTTLYEDLMKDPAQKARIEKIQKYNLIVGKTPKTEEVFTKKSDEIAGNTKVEIGGQTMTLKQALEDGFIDQNELNAMTNNSEIVTKAKEVETLKNEYDEKLRQYKNLEKTIKDELKGTGATTTDLAIAVANAQEKLLPGLQELESRTNNAIGTLTQMKTDSAQLFATNLRLYEKIEDRAYAEQQATKQLEQQYAYQFGDLNSDNPTLQNIAIERAVKSMYENYPIPGMESQSVKVQKVKNLMAQGMSGTQAIAQVESEIRNSQRYKDYLASEKAKITPQADKPFTVSSGSAVYDPATGTFKYPTATTSTGGTTTNSVDLISKWEGFRDKAYQDVGGVWTYGHGFITRPDGTPVQPGDTISEAESKARLGEEIAQRQNYMNFVTVPLSESQKAALSSFEFNLGSGIWNKEIGGAQSVIEKINAGDFAGAGEEMKKFNKARINGQLQSVQGLSNRRNEEARLIQDVTTSSQYTDQQIGELAYLVELQEKNPTQAAKDMKELGYTPKDIANYKSGNMPLTEKQKNSSIEVLESIKDLIKNYDWNDAVGKFDYSRAFGLQGAEDAKIVIDNLIAKMTLPNLGVLKGPMSDKDIEFIKAASSKLGTTQSNESFEKNIIEAYNLSARRAGLPEIKKLSDIKTGTSTENTYTGGGRIKK